MPKIAVIKFTRDCIFSGDYEDVYKTLADSISDWDEVTDDQYELLETYLPKDKYEIITYCPKKEAFSTIEQYIEKANKERERKEREKKKYEEKNAAKIKEREEKKKKKELALLKELEAKYKKDNG